MGGKPSESKIKVAVQRYREKAEKLIDDSEALEKLLGQMQEQTDRSAQLRDDLAPLIRLTRSYVRGSYRDIDRSKVVLACSAFLYVNNPLDFVPDWLPRGLKDDEWVARWAISRLEPELEAYAQWEEGLNAELVRPADSTVEAGSDSDIDLGLDVRVLTREESRLFASPRGEQAAGPPPIALGPAAVGVAELVSTLGSGEIMRVVNSSDLLSGIAEGSLQHMQTAQGLTGTVTDGSEIVGNLRFEEPGLASSIQAPLAAFQLASAVTLQYYLERIDRQLQEIDRQVRQIDQELQDERFGQIQSAAEASEDLEHVLRATGGLTDRDEQKLTHAEQKIDDAFHTLKKSLLSFQDEVDAKLADLEGLKKKELAELLEAGSGRRLYQAQMLVFTCVIRHRLNALAAVAAAGVGTKHLGVALAKVRREQEEMVEMLTQLAATFRRLRIPKRTLDETWSTLGGPEKELVTFLKATEPLSSFLAAPEEALPALESPAPVLFELAARDDGSLLMNYSELRPTEAQAINAGASR